MEESPRNRRSCLQIFVVLVILLSCGGGYWWYMNRDVKPVLNGPLGSGVLEPVIVPGGKLVTCEFVKTEELRKADKIWRGTTSSGIRLDATYRYAIELRGEWNIHLDDTRKVAFVVAPLFQPEPKVAVDSESVQEWTSSGWGRFDKWDHLQGLREQVSPELKIKAESEGYREIARELSRKTVEEFISDWLITRPAQGDPGYLVKVYFEDEKKIPFPGETVLNDFLP